MALSNEMFAEAANYWDLERLYKALAEAKKQISPHARRGLTEREKLFLRGLLCGYSPAEIARKLVQSRKGVEVYMSKTLYQYLRKMSDVPNEKVEHWRKFNNLLEEAGYKINSQEKTQSKNHFPQELCVKIGNICFDSNTGTIDINIRVSLPSVAEGQRIEDLD